MKPTKLTPLHRQAIDIAARVMWVEKWAEHERLKECVLCPHSAASHEELQRTPTLLSAFNPPFNVMCRECQKANRNMDSMAHYHSATRYDDWKQPIVPLTPKYAKLAAALWLGHVERANGCGLDVIVEAGRESEVASWQQQNMEPQFREFDLFAFISALTLEALGRGVSWFDDHERFTLSPYGADPTFKDDVIDIVRDLGHALNLPMDDAAKEIYHLTQRLLRRTEERRPFILPPLEFEYDEEEASR